MTSLINSGLLTKRLLGSSLDCNGILGPGGGGGFNGSRGKGVGENLESTVPCKCLRSKFVCILYVPLKVFAAAFCLPQIVRYVHGGLTRYECVSKIFRRPD